MTTTHFYSLIPSDKHLFTTRNSKNDLSEHYKKSHRPLLIRLHQHYCGQTTDVLRCYATPLFYFKGDSTELRNWPALTEQILTNLHFAQFEYRAEPQPRVVYKLRSPEAQDMLYQIVASQCVDWNFYNQFHSIYPDAPSQKLLSVQREPGTPQPSQKS